MRRREFLAAAAATIAMPAIARGQARQVLTFIPQADLAVLDPIWTTTYQTRDHAFLVFDTLFGVDDSYTAQPQMVEGAVTERRRQAVAADPAPGAQIPRRHACAGARLRCQRQALGRARFLRPGPDGGDR